jgi:hypothetical protein
MRLLLDAHISGRTVGKALTEGGHDVRALDSERDTLTHITQEECFDRVQWFRRN